MTDTRGIIAAVAKSFGVSEADLRGPSRRRTVAGPRQAAYWLLRHLRPWNGIERTYPQIAASLGRADHGTVIHGIGVAEAIMERDQAYLTKLADAGAMIAALAPMEKLAPAALPREVRTPAGPFRHVRPRNEPARHDTDARMRLHGTHALGRALQDALRQAQGERK